MKQAKINAGFLLDLLFESGDKCDIFLRNVGRLPQDYMALHPKRLTLHSHSGGNVKSSSLQCPCLRTISATQIIKGNS
jgi:hypothetical protein